MSFGIENYQAMNFGLNKTICRDIIMDIPVMHPGREHTRRATENCAIYS